MRRSLACLLLAAAMLLLGLLAHSGGAPSRRAAEALGARRAAAMRAAPAGPRGEADRREGSREGASPAGPAAEEGGLVSGVVNEDEEVPSNARVVARRYDDPFGPETSVAVDSSGHFSIRLPVAEWRLHAEAPDWVADSDDDVQVEPAREAHVSLRVERAKQTVWGYVTDPDRRPVSGAMVMGSKRRERTLTDASGGYRLPLPWAEHEVVASAPGFPCTRERIEDDGGALVRADIQLLPAHRITGRVQDSRGRPLASVKVTVEPRDDDAGEDRDGRTTLTDPEGRFALEGVGPGAHQCRAEADGFEGDYKDIDLPSDEPVVLTLLRFGAIEGQVLGAPPSQTPSLMMVVPETYARGYRLVHVTWQPDGGFVAREVCPGRAVIEAHLGGRAPARSAEFEVPEGETAKGVVIDLSAGASVVGTVRSARTGEAIAGAFVRDITEMLPYRRGQQPIPADGGGTHTDATGGFRLDHLPAGRRSLLFFHAAFVERVVEVQVGEAGGVPLDVALDAGARLRVRLHSTTPHAATDFSVSASFPHPQGVDDRCFQYDAGYGTLSTGDNWRAKWSPAGPKDPSPTQDVTFELKGLPPGMGWVQARIAGAGGDVYRTYRLDLRPDSDRTLDIAWDEGTRVRGTVIGNGAPVSRGGFQLTSCDGSDRPSFCGYADESGNVDIPGVPPGTYVLSRDGDFDAPGTPIDIPARTEVTMDLRLPPQR